MWYALETTTQPTALHDIHGRFTKISMIVKSPLRLRYRYPGDLPERCPITYKVVEEREWDASRQRRREGREEGSMLEVDGVADTQIPQQLS
jgi:hypothetical protein